MKKKKKIEVEKPIHYNWCGVDGRDCWVIDTYGKKMKSCDSCIYLKNRPVLRRG